MNISVPLPESVYRNIHDLAQENFNLWIFIAQNDLYEEAEEFISNDTYDRIYDHGVFPYAKAFPPEF